MNSMTDVMRQNMTDWLMDCVYEYLIDSNGEFCVSADELHGVLFSFINEEYNLVRSQFGQIPVGEIDEIIHNVIWMVHEGGHLKKEGRYTYQGLDVHGEPIFVDTDDYQEAKQNYVWGTYGKNGKDKLKLVRLVDCDSDHLRAILMTQKQISVFTYKLIEDILRERETKIKLDEELFTL